MRRQIKLAVTHGLKVPSAATKTKYGLRDIDWLALAANQKYVCAVCKKLPPSGRLCIDHEHVKGYRKMPAAEKRKYVRGLLCSYCNRFLVGKNTPLHMNAVHTYVWGVRSSFDPNGPVPAPMVLHV